MNEDEERRAEEDQLRGFPRPLYVDRGGHGRPLAIEFERPLTRRQARRLISQLRSLGRDVTVQASTGFHTAYVSAGYTSRDDLLSRVRSLTEAQLSLNAEAIAIMPGGQKEFRVVLTLDQFIRLGRKADSDAGPEAMRVRMNEWLSAQTEVAETDGRYAAHTGEVLGLYGGEIYLRFAGTLPLHGLETSGWSPRSLLPYLQYFGTEFGFRVDILHRIHSPFFEPPTAAEN